MVDSIEYEILNWQPREVWKCQGACAKYRHRRVVKGILPAVCCGVPAKLIDRYQQPTAFQVEQAIATLDPEPVQDEALELVMARMQAASLFFPEPSQKPEKDA
jgi:hypothetical protein